MSALTHIEGPLATKIQNKMDAVISRNPEFTSSKQLEANNFFDKNTQ